MKSNFYVMALLVGAAFLSSCAVGPGKPSGSEMRNQNHLPMNQELSAYLKSLLAPIATGQSEFSQASITVFSDRMGLYAHASLGGDGESKPFHVASIGKVFTAVAIGQLVAEGALSYESKIADILKPQELEGLFVFGKTDYRDQVRVSHLLAHSSGLADYFGDRAKDGGPSVGELMVREPNQNWTPDELLSFTRKKQEALFAPGKGFHYSDTGYILLGKIAEAKRGKLFDQILDEHIFKPLEMNHTWMPLLTKPKDGREQIRPAWVFGTDLSNSRSISADWAGGGIASTELDLVKFQQALWSGKLIPQEQLAEFGPYEAVFAQGMHYGKGMMKLKFEEFSPELAGIPPMYGHMGVLSTQMYYQPDLDLHIVISFGSDKAHEASVRTLIQAYMAILQMQGSQK